MTDQGDRPAGGRTAFRPAAVVTISATYGAGGSVIAPAVASALGLPFLDRLVSPDLAHAARSSEGLSKGEEKATPQSRILTFLAHAAPLGSTVAPPVAIDEDQALRERAESGIAELRRGRGGVILGRAGAVVLAGRPRAFHVRLDGPPERRAALAARIEGLGVEGARQRMNETDRARSVYVRRLYRVDPATPSLYHMILDTTVLGVEASTDLIVRAAQAAWAADAQPATGDNGSSR